MLNAVGFLCIIAVSIVRLCLCIVLILTCMPVHGLLCMLIENKAVHTMRPVCRSLSYGSSCIFPFYWLQCVSQPACLSHRITASKRITTLCALFVSLSVGILLSFALNWRAFSHSLFSAIFIQVTYALHAVVFMRFFVRMTAVDTIYQNGCVQWVFG